MAERLEPQLCVIGSGPGAAAAAIAAAAQGTFVLWVRQEPGSLALRFQALAAAAERAHLVRGAADFGVTTGEVRVDYGALKRHIRRVVEAAAPNEAPERLAGLGIRVIDGPARFTGRSTIVLDDRFEVKAEHFVIAIGSNAVLPEIDGLSGDILTPEQLLDLPECPESLAVIGGSAQGLELASAFRRLGAAVTVIAPPPFLPDEDPECAAVLLQRLQEAGLAFARGRPLKAVKSDGEIKLLVEDGVEMVRATHIVAAGGRVAAIADLGLDAAGVSVSAAGIVVDDQLRTGNPNVSAIGEAVGARSTQAANRQAVVAVQNALRNAKLAAQDEIVPRVLFTDPEFAHVGLSEEEARRRHRAIRVLRWPFCENDRARIEHDKAGHIKIVASGEGVVVGVTLVGRGVGEQIGTFALAVERRLGLHDLTNWVLPHASRAEIGRQALTGLEASGLTPARSGSIMQLLRRRG